MTSLQHLLPAPDESVRCADHSRSLSVDPGGTAIGCDRVVLIETPLPWPKPVFDHPGLVAVAPILKGSTVATRTLAYVGEPTSASGRTVITFDRNTGADGPEVDVIERRFTAKSDEELVALGIALANDDRSTVSAMAGYEEPLSTPVALVCTQGSHDVCCGSEGARFAADAETIADLTVYRVSHTGGHRFAPTAMTLPDGRMWADLDLDLIRAILTRSGGITEAAAHCRGWWGAAPGPAQMAERAVFETVGWDFDDRKRTVEKVEFLDGASRYLVASGERSWEVTVDSGRTLPTIACRQPGGLPAKQSIEYAIQRVTELPVGHPGP